MSIEQDTGNAEKLPLLERAKQGLLLFKPSLSLGELLFLEHPTDGAARKALGAKIRVAIDCGNLAGWPDTKPARREWRPARFAFVNLFGERSEQGRWVTYPAVTTYFVKCEAYPAWRKAMIAVKPSLFSHPLASLIDKWLGDAPATPESIPPVETSLPELPSPARLTEAQQDKADCQAIARALWAEQPGATQADILKNSRIKPYLKNWPGKNTLPGWLSEVDPRPKEQRRGRPKAR